MCQILVLDSINWLRLPLCLSYLYEVLGHQQHKLLKVFLNEAKRLFSTLFLCCNLWCPKLSQKRSKKDQLYKTKPVTFWSKIGLVTYFLRLNLWLKKLIQCRTMYRASLKWLSFISFITIWLPTYFFHSLVCYWLITPFVCMFDW